MSDNCADCGSHKIYPDPDPSDWFCDDDVKVRCEANGQMITVGCRPHRVRQECETPEWCPKKAKAVKVVEESMNEYTIVGIYADVQQLGSLK
jgi:hypothetical protein